ncbi:MAG: hypothetical protein RLZZ299_253 [Pseudomonadota bacterium]
MARLLPALVALPLLAGCNRYETFLTTGAEQANFSNDADILFVVDNSGSMQEEAEALARNFDAFIARLTSAEGSNVATETLADAADNFIREHEPGSLFIDYQIGITTTSVMFGGGVSAGVDPGEAGLLVGPPIGRTADAARQFRHQLICDAAFWNPGSTPRDPDFVCPAEEGVDPELPGTISSDFLDCLCGAGAWQRPTGAGQEMGMEAAYMAMCRAAPEPPAGCYDFPSSAPVAFVEGDEHSNEGFLREGASTIVVVVTDEGDESPRKDGVGDTDVEPYVDAFAAFDAPVRFATIGPAWRDMDALCLGSATAWGVERYQNLVTATGGLYLDITELAENCPMADFASRMDALGGLLSQLRSRFALAAIPDADTIRTWVDGVEIARSVLIDGSEETGDALYDDGWSYDAAENAVAFHGDAVPGYNADVRIYYRPLAGTPRELPF